MSKYTSTRIIDEKPRKIIVNENGKIVNRNPTKYELKDLKGFPKEKYKTNPRKDYTDKQLLSCLLQFYEKYGIPPTKRDFYKNSDYPSHKTYEKRFVSWSNALKLVGLDIESIVKKGILVSKQQKGRFAEIIVKDHFKKYPIDMAGENCMNPYDGICPAGNIYDVKSSGLHIKNGGIYWIFGTNNKHKDDIEIYYFLAFNEDYSELMRIWRVPGEIIEKNYFEVGLRHSYEFNIENMKEYDITNKIKEVLNRYGFFNKNKDVKDIYSIQLYDGYIRQNNIVGTMEECV